MQESRAASAIAGDARQEGASSSVESILRPVSGSEVDAEELIDLRRTSTELREVVRYMKRERDLLEAKLSVAEGDSSRLTAALAVTQRALDETRAELKRELGKRSNVRDEEEFRRLIYLYFNSTPENMWNNPYRPLSAYQITKIIPQSKIQVDG